MTAAGRSKYSRLAAAAAAAVAAVAALAASIALPTAVITVYALRARDIGLITAFANSVAEPLGLLGAGAATFGVTRFAVRKAFIGRAVVPWIGGAAAAAMIGAALWVGDFDVWTAAAAVVVPGAALLAGRRGSVAEAARVKPLIDAPPDLPLPEHPPAEPIETLRQQ